MENTAGIGLSDCAAVLKWFNYYSYYLFLSGENVECQRLPCGLTLASGGLPTFPLPPCSSLTQRKVGGLRCIL